MNPSFWPPESSALPLTLKKDSSDFICLTREPTLDATRSPRWALEPVLSPGTPRRAAVGGGGVGRSRVRGQSGGVLEQPVFKDYTKTDSVVKIPNDKTTISVMINKDT